MAMTPNKFPELELIQTVGYFVDADKSDELIKDIFIWWVEKFEDVGIDFLDGEGVLWAYTEPIDKKSIEVRAKDPEPPCKALSEIHWEKVLIKDEQQHAKDQSIESLQ